MSSRGAVTSPDDPLRVPLSVRIGFAHAAVQWQANELSARVLHIKGAAVDRSLVGARGYSDADVLISPSDLSRLLMALQSAGWQVINSFAHGSPFEHSATLRHPDFGLLDAHRIFPGFGIEAQAAFDALWLEHETRPIGGMDCAVPAPGAQALVLLLHAARSGSEHKAARDVEMLWTQAAPQDRAVVESWVQRLGADLAFSVITGTLDEHRGDPEHDLWKVASRGGTRVEEWRARIKAAPGWGAKLSLAGRSVLVNVEHLELIRGRAVSRREIVVEFFARPVRGVTEVLGQRRARRG